MNTANDGQPSLATPALAVQGVSKHFGGVQALKDVSVAVMPGTVHALVGANGAGKSTLGKVIGGAVEPDAGQIFVNGVAVRYRSPADALSHGVALMQQEIALAPHLSAIENVCLGTEPRQPFGLSRRSEREVFDALLERTGFDLSRQAIVGDLRIAQQQEVSVLWALARQAQIIVMDEPTASLDREEASKLLRTVRQLQESGITVVYVSHFLEEVLEVADTVTVMANGRHIWTRPAPTLDVRSMVVGMLGEAVDETLGKTVPVSADAALALSVTGLSQPPLIEDLTFEVFQGEILGIYGLIGAGRSEMAHALAGGSGAFEGTVEVDGRPADLSSPAAAIRSGIVLLPESRKDQGLFLNHSQLWNTTIAALARFSPYGILNHSRENAAAAKTLDSMSVVPSNLSGLVGQLSGGNQQKVLFAKCVLAEPAVLILDEPTRGVDVGAKRAIYDVIAQIAANGTAVILISSEHEEVTRLSHRLLVMREGRIVASYNHGEADGPRITRDALGVTHRPDIDAAHQPE